MPNLAQNEPLFVELDQQNHHFLYVLAIHLDFDDVENSITYELVAVNSQ